MSKEYISLIRFSENDEKIWWNCSHADFSRVWDHLTCWLSRVVLEWCFLESGLTKSFTVCNFRKKVAMTIIFFSKCFKFDLDYRNGIKKWVKVFGFKENCTWIGDYKSSQSRTGYLSLAVNELRNTPKI